jgi:hypothetical protein
MFLSAFSERWDNIALGSFGPSLGTRAFEKVAKPEKPTTEKGLNELECSEMLKGLSVEHGV